MTCTHTYMFVISLFSLRILKYIYTHTHRSSVYNYFIKHCEIKCRASCCRVAFVSGMMTVVHMRMCAHVYICVHYFLKIHKMIDLLLIHTLIKTTSGCSARQLEVCDFNIFFKIVFFVVGLFDLLTGRFGFAGCLLFSLLFLESSLLLIQKRERERAH